MTSSSPSPSPSPSRYPLYLSPLEQLGHEFFDGLKAHEDDSLNTIIIIIIIIDREAMRRHHQFAGCTHYSITSQLKQHYTTSYFMTASIDILQLFLPVREPLVPCGEATPCRGRVTPLLGLSARNSRRYSCTVPHPCLVW